MFLRLINYSMTTQAFLPLKKKSTVTCNLIFLGQSCNLSSSYHHRLGDFKFQFAQKKNKKHEPLSSPAHCSPNCWTWNGHEVQQKSFCMGAWISPKSLPAIRIHQKKMGDPCWGNSSQKTCRMGKCWNRGEVLRASNKFFQNREGVMVGSQLLNNLSGSGIRADHPNGTTEPRKKTLTFHWILVGLIGILIYTYIMVPHTTGYDFIPHIYTKPQNGSLFFSLLNWRI